MLHYFWLGSAENDIQQVTDARVYNAICNCNKINSSFILLQPSAQLQ